MNWEKYTKVTGPEKKSHDLSHMQILASNLLFCVFNVEPKWKAKNLDDDPLGGREKDENNTTP